LAARTKKRCSPDRLSLPQVHMRQRWYDAQLQRFISTDPIGLYGGANLYGYCGNNPINSVDPQGLDGAGGATMTLPGAGALPTLPSIPEILGAIPYFPEILTAGGVAGTGLIVVSGAGAAQAQWQAHQSAQALKATLAAQVVQMERKRDEADEQGRQRAEDALRQLTCWNLYLIDIEDCKRRFRGVKKASQRAECYTQSSLRYAVCLPPCRGEKNPPRHNP